MIALDLWRDYIMKSHDDRAVRDLLHPDAVFESPVVHTPQRGRDIVFKYLTTADKVMGGPNFRYVGEWRSDNGVVLEFETEIEGIKINGVDMITLSADGSLITHFKVMVRPLKAINLLHRLMGEQWRSRRAMSALHGQRPAAFKPATARQTMDGTLLADAIKRRRKWPV